jgi:alginate O-acetyltransferase complex protein AlgJ
VVRGRDGWLYFAPELRHLEVGRFWGERAAAVSRARRAEWADPLPAILDFARQLDERGIALLFVPVPAKAVIHPEGLPPAYAELSDAADRAFYEVLRGEGVEVLELGPVFDEARAAEAAPLYLRQDTHWADPAIRAAARRIAERLVELGVERGEGSFATRAREIEIRGDLWEMLGDEGLAQERVTLTAVGRGSDLAPVEPSPDSPVLLLGDSHSLVFHAGGALHARGAGLPDHLARELGFPVDLVAVRGSGATPARVDLLRRGDALQGKRAVVWCLSVREFTESVGGWRVLPVAR